MVARLKPIIFPSSQIISTTLLPRWLANRLQKAVRNSCKVKSIVTGKFSLKTSYKPFHSHNESCCGDLLSTLIVLPSGVLNFMLKCDDAILTDIFNFTGLMDLARSVNTALP